MPLVGPISRRDFIRALRSAGFEGPLPGGRHEGMWRGNHTVRIPNTHGGDISTGLLLRALKQAGITRDEWERL